MGTRGELSYLAREGEAGELNARTPTRTDLFIQKTVTIADGRDLVARESAVSASPHQTLLDRCGVRSMFLH